MATKKLIQLEFDKFQTTPSGDVAIRTISTTPQPSFGQVLMTGSVIQLGSNPLSNGVILSAKSGNAASIMIGGNSGVLNSDTGGGNAYILEPGNSISYACENTNQLYTIGTSGDVLSFAGS